MFKSKASALLLGGLVSVLSSFLNQGAIATPQLSSNLKQDNYSILLQRRGTLTTGDSVLSQDDSLYDAYTFEGRAGQPIAILLESQAFDTYLVLVDPNGEVLATNDDMDSTTNSGLSLVLPSNGTYTVLANSYDSSGRGQYVLTVATPSDASPAVSNSSPEDIVEALYNDFSPMSDRFIFNESAVVMGRYFNDELINLILEDQACEEQSGGICNLDFDPLADGQDADIRSLQIGSFDATRDQLVVTVVHYRMAGRQLIFKFENTPRGWRISDIISSNGSSLAERLQGRW